MGMERHKSVRTQQRIIDMVFLRSQLQKLVLSSEKTDYVILIDLDIEGFSYDGILNSLTYDFDVMASNGLIYKEGIRYYFDSYGSKFNPEKTDEEKNKILIHRGEKPIKCCSAFGGLAVYKWDAYSNGKYSVGDWTRYCEHIPFHEKMKCFINPSQIVLYSKTNYSI